MVIPGRRRFFTDHRCEFVVHFELMIDLKNERLRDPVTSIVTLGELQSATMVSTVDTQTDYHKILSEYVEITQPSINSRSGGLPGSTLHIYYWTASREPTRKLSGEKLRAAKTEIDFLLEQGII
ncbi:hypothetical protein QLX08_005914 [Tetragonisca angustula]|uniref:Uncharacterized protein n=1 Tax=Tetragonisca angustula TaxID=166442 RepID=A0AAW0ZYY4_9HYME